MASWSFELIRIFLLTGLWSVSLSVLPIFCQAQYFGAHFSTTALPKLRCYVFSPSRATYEHTTRHITDWHTEATYAGVRLDFMEQCFCWRKYSLKYCGHCVNRHSSFQSEQRWRRHEQKSRGQLRRHAERTWRTGCRRCQRKGSRWQRRYWQAAAVGRRTWRSVRRLQC